MTFDFLFIIILSSSLEEVKGLMEYAVLRYLEDCFRYEVKFFSSKEEALEYYLKLKAGGEKFFLDLVKLTKETNFPDDQYVFYIFEIDGHWGAEDFLFGQVKDFFDSTAEDEYLGIPFSESELEKELEDLKK